MNKGWKLVPIEPTEEMCRAAEESEHGSSSKPWFDGMHSPENVEGLYKIMLAAAPTPAPTPAYLVTYASGDTAFFEQLPESLPPGCMVQEQPPAQAIPLETLIAEIEADSEMKAALDDVRKTDMLGETTVTDITIAQEGEAVEELGSIKI